MKEVEKEVRLTQRGRGGQKWSWSTSARTRAHYSDLVLKELKGEDAAEWTILNAEEKKILICKITDRKTRNKMPTSTEKDRGRWGRVDQKRAEH